MSAYSTIQSRKFVLTKEETDYFATHDMKQYIDMVERERNQTMKGAAGERETYYFKHPYPYMSPYTVGCRAFANIISTFVVDKKCQIIDIAAGSGLLGIEMKKLGFQNIDGLEPVEDMVKMQPDGIYGKLYREFIGNNNPSSIPTVCAIIVKWRLLA
ncbi:uncharacterized protein [Amphiura filiformis]|uniref:uncharacterized protein n=1 Tax=Amphiura filiformis TaxID=82378 RepID=UPI003B20D608